MRIDEFGDVADNVSILEEAGRLERAGRHDEARALLEELLEYLGHTSDVKSRRLLDPVVRARLAKLRGRSAPRAGRRMPRSRLPWSLVPALRDFGLVLPGLRALVWKLMEVVVSILVAIDIVRHHLG